ncbi:MAG: thiamine-phosphate kinase [Armatimonadota bacterium]
MKISEFGGENAVIKLIEKLHGEMDDPRVVVGFGDDAALVRTCTEMLQIITTDLLIEGTHFRQDIIDPYSLGWKSVAVNISDVAAMGGVPTWAFVSIAFPDIEVEFIEQLYEGMNDISRRFGSRIIGGDTNNAEGNIVINVAQLGEVEEDRAAKRNTARPGDRILVTGTIGDSLAGFRLLDKLGLAQASKDFPQVAERHLRPIPRVSEARAAVKERLVGAMMDLSDGLAIDLGKMCEASSVGARVFEKNLPVSESLKLAASALNMSPESLASSGGEDYELLIAAAPENVEKLIQTVQTATGTRVTEIGEFIEGDRITLVQPDGAEAPLKTGWKHFDLKNK